MEIDGILRAILISDGKEVGSPMLHQLGGDLPESPVSYRISDLGVKDFEIRSFRPKCARFEVFPKNVKVDWKGARRICRIAGGELAHFATHVRF